MQVKKRIYQIDFLRFVAALGILSGHYLYRGFKADNLTNLSFLELGGNWVKYSFVFIDLFFIISGFVIALSLRNKSLSYFFKSRVMRIFSVYWLCVFITYMVTLFFGAPRFSATFGQFLFNLTLLQDFFDVPRLDGAYWTMSVELRFYALAMAYLVLYKYIKVKMEIVAYWWLAISILFLFLQGTFINRLMNLFFMFEFSSAFIAGIIMAVAYRAKKFNTIQAIALLLCFGLSCYHRLIYAHMSMVYYNETGSSLLVVFVLFIVYLVMVLLVMEKFKWLNKPYFLSLGMITFPLYLLHQRIGYIIFNNLMDVVNKYVLLAGTVALMIGVSFVIIKWISPPMTRSLDNLMDKLIRMAENRKSILKPISPTTLKGIFKSLPEK